MKKQKTFNKWRFIRITLFGFLGFSSGWFWVATNNFKNNYEFWNQYLKISTTFFFIASLIFLYNKIKYEGKR